MSRALATIQRIRAVRPIPGADAIEVAEVRGWPVVIKKGEFAVGDLCVYFEIDSFLPSSEPAFAFLAKDFRPWNGKEGVRLRTIKLRKQTSQGLALKPSAFAKLSGSLSEGDDVTEILNIEKWESPEELKANSPGGSGSPNKTRAFPWFIRKTDQERVQNRIDQLSGALDETFEKSIKLDGSSMTVYILRKGNPIFEEEFARREVATLKKMSMLKCIGYWIKRAWNGKPDYIAGVCSRNMEVDLNGDSAFAKYVRDHGIIQKIAEGTGGFQSSLAFQGELVAPSIQGNYEKVSKPEWYVYDVFDIERQTYLLPMLARFEAKNSNLDYVPVLDTHASLRSFLSGDPEETPRDLVEGILNDAEGEGMNPGVKREGVVYKPNSTDFSFKAISNSYLLHKG